MPANRRHGAEPVEGQPNTFRTGRGTIVIDPVAGTYVYTPTGTARLDASRIDANADELYEDVTFVVNDHHAGGVREVPITLPIIPLTIAGDQIVLLLGPGGSTHVISLDSRLRPSPPSLRTEVGRH